MDLSNVTSAVIGFATTHTWVATFLLVMGFLRTFMKPLMAIINGYALFAPAAQANAIKQVEASSFYTWFVFAVDYFASIKLPGTAAKALKASKKRQAVSRLPGERPVQP